MIYGVHTITMDSSNSSFITGSRIQLPNFDFLQFKTITRIDANVVGQQGAESRLALTLVDTNDQSILLDYPLANLQFTTTSVVSNLNRRYFASWNNISLNKSFLRSFDPSLSIGVDAVYLTFYYQN